MYDLNQVSSAYDTLTHKVKTDLDGQYNAGRLTGSDYANVYAQLMGQCLQLAFQAPELESSVNLNNEKLLDQRYVTTYIRPAEKENTDADTALKNKQIDVESAQIDKINKDIDVEERRTKIQEDQSAEDLLVKQQQIASGKAQEDVYERQKQGFDDKLKMDLTKMQLDTWGMMFSSGLLCDDNGNCAKPNMISNDEVTTLYNNIKTQLGI